MEGLAGTAAVAVIAVAIPVLAGTLGHGPAAPRRRTRGRARRSLMSPTALYAHRDADRRRPRTRRAADEGLAAKGPIAITPGGKTL